MFQVSRVMGSNTKPTLAMSCLYKCLVSLSWPLLIFSMHYKAIVLAIFTLFIADTVCSPWGPSHHPGCQCKRYVCDSLAVVSIHSYAFSTTSSYVWVCWYLYLCSLWGPGHHSPGWLASTTSTQACRFHCQRYVCDSVVSILMLLYHCQISVYHWGKILLLVLVPLPHHVITSGKLIIT